jgi:kelch-like protein 10
VFGGFDGRERLNTIERYHAKENKWSVIETKFKNGFSNAASVSYTDNKILILGGGSNQGFTLDL